MVYQITQKVSYSYDFNTKKILDPLSLSVALKQLGVLSKDEQDQLSANLPEVKHKLSLLTEVQKILHDSVIAKFQESFTKRDLQSMVGSIQIFFNLEILSDQIQNRVNMTLRTLNAAMKTQVSSL